MNLQENVIKDAEFAEIMRDFKNRISDWALIGKMIDMSTEMINAGNKDKVVLQKLLYKISDSIFGMHWNYPKEDIRHELRFPGNHDFNAVISRYFDDTLLGRYMDDVLPFYAKWIDVMRVYIESKGFIYPRYVPEIRILKKTERMPDNKRFSINDTVLLTREDASDIKGIEECNLPCYYAIPNENMHYGTLEEMEKLFNYKEYFEKYKVREYPIHYELEHNTEKYKHLSNTVVI